MVRDDPVAEKTTNHPTVRKFTNDEVFLAEGYLKVFDTGTRTLGWRASTS